MSKFIEGRPCTGTGISTDSLTIFPQIPSYGCQSRFRIKLSLHILTSMSKLQENLLPIDKIFCLLNMATNRPYNSTDFIKLHKAPGWCYCTMHVVALIPTTKCFLRSQCPIIE